MSSCWIGKMEQRGKRQVFKHLENTFESKSEMKSIIKDQCCISDKETVRKMENLVS